MTAAAPIVLWQFAPSNARSSDTVYWLDSYVLEAVRETDPLGDGAVLGVLLLQCEALVRRACRRGKDCGKFGVGESAARAWAEAWALDVASVFVAEIGFNAEGQVCKVGAVVPRLPGDDPDAARFIRVNHRGSWGVFRVLRSADRDTRRCVAPDYLLQWCPEFKVLGAAPCLNPLALLPHYAVDAAAGAWRLRVN